MACINIPTLIEESIGEGATVDYSGECFTECIPMWRDSGSAVCINGESKVPQVDGCGNSRMVLGGDACCIPTWAPTGEEKCENAISFREEFDGCGEYRWVQGGSACCIPKWVGTPMVRCLDGVSQQLWVDGCTSSEWRAGGNACHPPQTLENTGVYVRPRYASPTDGYWNNPANCDFRNKHPVVILGVDTSPHAAAIKQLALQGAKITLREQWIDGAPYLGNAWPASAGAVKMLRFDVNGTGPEVGYLAANTSGGGLSVFMQSYGWRRMDNTITWCNGAKTSLTYPPDGSTGTYLGLHSYVYPPQVNGADYRVTPFASYLWKDAEGYHFVSVDSLFHNSTSWAFGQCVGIQGDSATDPMVWDTAIWSCGITSSRKVLEFNASCLITESGG